MQEVEPIEGEPLRFMVRSRRSASRYLVDLEPYRLNGQCGCHHFQYRLEPTLAKGEAPHASLRCYHIKRARAHILEKLLPKLAEEVNRRR